jgi:hypothetical protein
VVGVKVMRCPSCRAIDWFRDGYRIFGGVGGEVLRRRAAPADPAADRAPWYCVGCGYQAEQETPVGDALSDIQRAHFE